MIKIFLIKEGIGMEFREIVTFLQAAKLQSFSKAARQLGYSQAAVTIQIKQLEQELGVHLFDRIGKQSSPKSSVTAFVTSLFFTIGGRPSKKISSASLF